MFKTPQARLPRRITLAVFIILLIAIVAAQAEGQNRSVAAAVATPKQADSGLLVRRMARVAVELLAPSRRAGSLSGTP